MLCYRLFISLRPLFYPSSYMQKCMAEIEMKVSENVMKACARTPSVTKCVLTSSLLACIWRDNTQYDLSSVVQTKRFFFSFFSFHQNTFSWKKLAEEATGPHGSSSINLDKLVNDVLLSKC
jgi:hypothetical protein